MRQKIQKNIEEKQYTKQACGPSLDVYINHEQGWLDYLISENIIFSHRKNDYISGELPERLHFHDYYELTLIANKENIEYISDEKNVFVHSGMGVLTKPMKFHMFRLPFPICYDRYVIYFKDPNTLFPQSSFTDFTRLNQEACSVFALTGDKLLTISQKIEVALTDPTSPHAAAKAYLEIGRLFLSLSESPSMQTNSIALPIPNFVTSIKDYIDENFLSLHNVQSVTQHFFYSREHISRCFKQYYNTPIYEYILEKKLLHFKHLLLKGEGIEAAARICGFSNMSSFVKLFRKKNGCTPSEYRQKYSK